MQLNVIKNTVAKQSTEDSTKLKDEHKVPLIINKYEIESIEDIGNKHIKVAFNKPLKNNLNEWWLFAEHIDIPGIDIDVSDHPLIEEQQIDLTEVEKVKIEEEVKKIQTNWGTKSGRTMNVPGKGLTYSNELIIANGHFTWGEATKNCSRVPLSSTITNNIILAAKRLEKIRSRYDNKPIYITSWYRPPAINRAVGGASQSKHLQGHAFDFYVIGKNIFEVERDMLNWWSGGLGKGSRKGFIHGDCRDEFGERKAIWNY